MANKSKWTCKVTVEFVPLPPEREEAYWAAMKYFAEVIHKEINKSEEGDERKDTNGDQSPFGSCA